MAKVKAKKETRVGVRELRQNLSVYLKRVKGGECLQVTERGRPVAQLMPLPPGQSWLEGMIAAGLATRAKGNLADLGPPPKRPEGAPPLSQYLAELREDRI